MEVSKSRLNRCSVYGDKFESLFMKKVIARGLKFRDGTNEDDWYKHIDCYVNGFGVDVKGNRHQI